jgi:hypothetical protein
MDSSGLKSTSSESGTEPERGVVTPQLHLGGALTLRDLSILSAVV